MTWQYNGQVVFVMSTSFGGFEPESDKATLPRLYRLVQADQYTITIGNALWATIVSSYDVTLPEGLTGYVVKEIDNTNHKAILQDVTAQGGLEGGKPYLLNAASAGTYTLNKATTAITEPAGNLLEVSDNTTGNGVYVLADKGNGAGFYKWMGGLLGAGRVYLEKAVSPTAPSYISFGFSETTGINSVDSGQVTVDSYYNLAGQRVDQPAKGLYIVNGKKVIK